ncbi:DNA-processing protein DprA [Pandoraea pnomenusa]|uniref:DNA-processing protein DprA n=1 Tax=Pandoraea pnomenusa TaxID=93220 RepID=UPI003C6E3837
MKPQPVSHQHRAKEVVDAAHDGALDTPGGTCAVVGTGADIVYPARHGALAERIAASGLLLSAFPIGTPPRPDHFPRRNRLIAALARCTLVVEAATQSGSLITARLAGELGRDVLAVPGSIHAPQSRGCHALIRDGATLATGPEDVLEALGAGNPLRPAPDVADQASVASTACVTSPSATSPVRPLPPGRAAILEALGYDPVSADTLCGRTGLGIAEVLAHLGALELDASVARLPGGRFVRHRPRGGAR